MLHLLVGAFIISFSPVFVKLAAPYGVGVCGVVEEPRDMTEVLDTAGAVHCMMELAVSYRLTISELTESDTATEVDFALTLGGTAPAAGGWSAGLLPPGAVRK